MAAASVKMTNFRQLPLNLSFRPALGRDDFMVGPCNEVAVAWIDQYPHWPVPINILCGGPGSGKSHLLAVWAARSKARIIDGTTLKVSDLDDRISGYDAVAVDRADHVAEPDSLFHLINMMRERSGYLLLAAHIAPAYWAFGTPDMKSRLSAAQLLTLNEPDDSVLAAVLIKQLSDRHLDLRPEVMRYMMDRMPRRFQAARDLVSALDKVSLAKRKPITHALAREAMTSLGFFDDM